MALTMRTLSFPFAVGSIFAFFAIESEVVTGGNVTINERCFIGAGTVATADAVPDGVYRGNPARRLPMVTSLGVT
jgi:UDP-3-O-[3-hydroxymyristoyl] glucosamine N-acyltransferase